MDVKFLIFSKALPHEPTETESATKPKKDQSKTDGGHVHESEDSATDKTDTEYSQHQDLLQKFDLLCIALSTLGFDYIPTSFIDVLPSISDEELYMIDKLTINQHENENWYRLRKGRITASKFYQVFTRVNTIHKKGKENVDCSSLIKLVMLYEKVDPNIKALKYGRETESIAAKAYLKSYKKKHTNVTSQCCGMVIDKQNVFLSASPDMLISCSCCGDGLLEVKCPLIPECESCESFCTCKLPDFIIFENAELTVKQNHAYYVQILGQLAITRKSWCDLYVYTVNGPFQQRIMFDSEYYTKCLLPNLKFFFFEYIVPELLHGDVLKQLQCNDISNELSESVNVDASVGSSQSRYYCPVCNCFIKEGQEILSYRDRSIVCEKCKLKFHFQCVKMTNAKLKKNEQWFCPGCAKEYMEFLALQCLNGLLLL